MTIEQVGAGCAVAGTVRRVDGTPAAGITVSVSERRLRSQAALGLATTGADGGYRVNYPAATTGDLIVRLIQNGQPVAEQRRPGGAPETAIDLILPGEKPTEYQNLVDAVTPLLDGARLADLVENDDQQDISFLARTAGRDQVQVALLALAGRHAVATGLPAEPFYGLLRQGLDTDLSALAQLPADTLQASLAAAVSIGTIGATTDFEDFTTRLRALEVAAAVADKPAGEASPLISVLAAAVPDAQIRARVYDAFLDRTESEARFWARLKTDPQVAPYVDRLRLALQLGAFTGNNPVMVQALLAKFDNKELTDLSQLVTLNDQWPQLVAAAGGAPAHVVPALLAKNEKVDATTQYAGTIGSLVEQAFPTAAVAHRLSADTASAAAKFLAGQPEFDLVATPVNAVTVPDEQARPELAEIQRVLKIAPRLDAMQALRGNGFSSAHAVAMTDPSVFAARLGDSVDADEAKAIHARATRVHAAAVNLVADLRTAGHFDVPWLAKPAAATAQIPNWDELFGSPDYCACPDCRSIHGEAAYLVDLLQYLLRLAPSSDGFARPADIPVPDQGVVADALYARRSDVVDLDLTCDNTNLAVPYIDLVNELLESAVAPDTAVPATARQSTGDQAQIRLQPQHLNPGAYDKLRTAVYPWDLPFDLWREQTNAYLKQLGVPRATLLAALGTYPIDPDETVNEQLGLAEVAGSIIAGEALTPPRTLAEYYGRPATTAGDALAAEMATVRTLLDATGMRYADLVSALESRFVNPGGQAKIVPQDLTNPCNTETLRVQPLDAGTLERLHRFVRLQRALNWTSPQLDRVIAAGNNQGRLDRAMLRVVAAVRQLATRLALDVDDVLCFFSPLETHPYPDEGTQPRYDRLFLDPTVVQTPPGVPNPFALNANRTEVAVAGDLLDPAVAAALLGILQVTDADLVALVTGPRAVTDGRVVNLANLTALVRTTTLASALALSVPDLLRLIELYGDGGPFPSAAVTSHREIAELASGEPMLPSVAGPAPVFHAGYENELAGGAPMVPPTLDGAVSALPPTDGLAASTERFLDAVDAITAAGFDVADVDAVLADVDDGGVLPDDRTLAATLTALRAAVQAVYRQTAQTTDDKGDLTRKELAQLGWDAGLVQDVVSTLLGTMVYTADLPALAAGIELPALPQLRYSPELGQLTFTGPMDDNQRTTLVNLPGADAAFVGAVNALHAAARTFVATRMKVLRIPIITARLDSLSPDFPFPKSLGDKVFFDATQRALCLRGYLSADDRDALIAAAGQDTSLQTAINTLFSAQETFTVTPDNALLTAADADTMFHDSKATGPADRLHTVLTRIAPYLRRTLSEITVKQQLGQAAGLDAATADALIGTWLRTPTATVALQDFLTPEFVGSDPAVAVDRAGFDRQFTSLSLLLRVAMVLTRLRATAAELPLVFGQAAAVGWLDLTRLPSMPVTGASPLFLPFVRLLDLYRLRNTIPGGSTTLIPVFQAATGADLGQVTSALAAGAGWNADDVARLAQQLDLVTPSRFADEGALLALLTAVRTVRKLGVSADRAVGWLASQLTQDAAQAAWQAAKSRYPSVDWTAVATPLQDGLRDRQRAALVSYLIANPLLAGDGSPQWTDTDGMHDYFLIDVEMGATQQTARIAQAIYTVQLFVQRCLLNLEPTVPGLSGVISEWEWMKQYRLWEANQKVFLYPENYLDPTLRLGKSPFFKELETELTQQDVTTEVAETALANYLQKLDDVAALIPCGIYQHLDGTQYYFARTDSTPRTYYFRTRTYDKAWHPWQRIDVDIDGDVLLPVVWQERLYLFWVTFSPTADTPTITMPAPNGTIGPAPTYMQFKLSWSQYYGGAWQPKRMAKDTLNTNLNQYISDRFDVAFWATLTDDYVFEPHIEDNGDLTIRCFSYQHYGLNVGSTHVVGVISGTFTVNRRTETIYVSPLTWYDEDGGQMPAWAVRVYGPQVSVFQNNFWMVWNANSLVELPVTDDDLLRPVLGKSVGRARILYPSQYIEDRNSVTKVYSDANRTYMLDRSTVTVSDLAALSPAPSVDLGHAIAEAFTTPSTLATAGTELARVAKASSALGVVAPLDNFYTGYVFIPGHHPYVDDFVERLNGSGVGYLLSRYTQMLAADDFVDTYDPNPDRTPPDRTSYLDYLVQQPFPVENVDFRRGSSYADYNWELFFYAPLLIAEKLAANQQFADGQQWFHYIFDPTSPDTYDGAPQRYWQTLPFFDVTGDDYYNQRIESIIAGIGSGDVGANAEMQRWLDNPFQPDIVAQLRTTAFQKSVVMKYLDNLIAWADQLFRQETWETISSAIQLYVLAAELLGRRPDEVTGLADPPPRSFRELQIGSAASTDAIVQAEHLMPSTAVTRPAIAPGLGLTTLNYFTIPRNDKLVGYWDTVADRLFKIRHGQNIDGVAQNIPLFGPPIDPNLLIRATIAGVDLATVLDDLNAPIPNYRFTTMLAKAKEFANEVKSFGAALLSALEKRDAEALARLRTTHELAVLKAARQVKVRQVDESGQALEAVRRSQVITTDKQKYYASKPRTNEREDSYASLTNDAMDEQDTARMINMIASAISAVPDVKIGTATTIGATWGSSNIIAGIRGVAEAIATGASIKHSRAALASTQGGWDHRFEDWQFQAGQAGLEISQYDSQIAAATIRQQIAQRELDNHDLQIANAQEDDQFLHGKYTNQELYDWMSGQLSTTYFQAYQLAYDVAKRAERAYRHELGVDDTDFVRFGYWDSLHKGLLSGERLAADLNRMDAAYLEANSREFELSKRISLAQLDPKALLSLKETGSCYVSLPEAIFDLDTPGHYFRRVRSLSVTVPCVAGPYTGVNLTATLLGSSVRVDPRVPDDGAYGRGKSDTRFRDAAGPIESIVTSTGQDDAGLFEANLRDERYLPFEGAGAISEWQLSLPKRLRQFDYESITDVVLHLRYTARDGGQSLADTAADALEGALSNWVRASGGKGLFRSFSLRREFADQWNRFVGGNPAVTLALAKTRFPYAFRDDRITLAAPQLVFVLSTDLIPDGSKSYVDCFPNGVGPVVATLTSPRNKTSQATLLADPALGGQPHGGFAGAGGQLSEAGENWGVTIPVDGLEEHLRTGTAINPDAVVDVLLVWPYTIEKVTQ